MSVRRSFSDTSREEVLQQRPNESSSMPQSAVAFLCSLISFFVFICLFESSLFCSQRGLCLLIRNRSEGASLGNVATQKDNRFFVRHWWDNEISRRRFASLFTASVASNETLDVKRRISNCSEGNKFLEIHLWSNRKKLISHEINIIKVVIEKWVYWRSVKRSTEAPGRFGPHKQANCYCVASIGHSLVLMRALLQFVYHDHPT